MLNKEHITWLVLSVCSSRSAVAGGGPFFHLMPYLTQPGLVSVFTLKAYVKPSQFK